MIYSLYFLWFQQNMLKVKLTISFDTILIKIFLYFNIFAVNNKNKIYNTWQKKNQTI